MQKKNHLVMMMKNLNTQMFQKVNLKTHIMNNYTLLGMVEQ
jgi:hypothetical protein